MTTFYNETGFADKGRAVDVFYLDFSNAFVLPQDPHRGGDDKPPLDD